MFLSYPRAAILFEPPEFIHNKALQQVRQNFPCGHILDGENSRTSPTRSLLWLCFPASCGLKCMSSGNCSCCFRWGPNSRFRSEVGHSTFLRNVGNHIQVDTASQSRRPKSTIDNWLFIWTKHSNSEKKVPFNGFHQNTGNPITNSVAPEPEGSSPHSQQPASGPYPEPGESTPPPSQTP
jgi:hypothetical protein